LGDSNGTRCPDREIFALGRKHLQTLDTDTTPPDTDLWHLADTIVAAFTSNPQNAVLDGAGREALRLSVYNGLAA
jgi:hypothetical protein